MHIAGSKKQNRQQKKLIEIFMVFSREGIGEMGEKEEGINKDKLAIKK